MFSRFLARRVFLSLVFILYYLPVHAQNITLIDFGSNESGNSFELAGWDNLLLSSRMAYTSAGPGGVVLASEFEEYSDFMGVSGIARDFLMGERIVASWYNNSDETIIFTSRISFTDSYQPGGGAHEGDWYTMRNFDDYRITYSEIAPHEAVRTVFNITDAGVHKSDGSHMVININLSIEWGQSSYKEFLVCDKIELFDDADITPPAAPENVTAEAVSDSRIQIEWNESSDNTGVVEYLVYLDGEVEGYTRSSSYEAVFLEPSTDYSFTVTALDMCGNESGHSASVHASTMQFSHIKFLLNPGGFNYLGSFRVPEEFNWGGEEITYRATGDGGQEGSGSGDGFPGSMFVTNLNQAAAGFVGEISIPEPAVSESKNIGELNVGVILQSPANIRPDNINNREYVDIWRSGLQYIEAKDKLYSSWTIHYTVSGEKNATISVCDASDLAGSAKNGAWYLGPASESPIDAMLNDYLISVPPLWVPGSLLGSKLAVGRFRDGGLSGLGPTLYAFEQVNDPLPANSELEFITMLEYGPVENSDGYNYPNSIDDYNHSDSWMGAAWMMVEDQTAMVFAGNKALGDNWYGYQGEMMRHGWVIADVPYPDFYETDPNGKGWRAHNYIPMIILYSPYDLSDVSRGDMETYEPQPYAAVRLDENIFWGGHQEISSAGYDSYNDILYISERVSEENGMVLIHAWQVDKIVSAKSETIVPVQFELHQNYPNPFNPATTIKYSIPSTGKSPPGRGRPKGRGGLMSVQLKVYNILGREVATLVHEQQAPGSYEVRWDASGEPSGVYFYKIQAGSFVEVKKMILLR